MKKIWVLWEITHHKNSSTATGYESRRMAYRKSEGKNIAVIQVEIIPRKFIRPAEPVPKKGIRKRTKKKRK